MEQPLAARLAGVGVVVYDTPVNTLNRPAALVGRDGGPACSPARSRACKCSIPASTCQRQPPTTLVRAASQRVSRKLAEIVAVEGDPAVVPFVAFEECPFAP